MRPKRWTAVLLAMVMLSAGGCALALVGAGVAGGYAISKDTVRNTFDISKEELFAHCQAVAEESGFVTSQDASRGTIKLKVQNTNVSITLKQLTRRTVELKVKARNTLMMPEIEIAQEIYNKIINRI